MEQREVRKDIDICGLGNPIVDVVVQCDDSELSKLRIDRGSMRLVDEKPERLQDAACRLVSGGSVANSVIANAQLGASAAFMGCIGADTYGAHFKSECESLGVICRTPAIPGSPTGLCTVYVSGDGERTMETSLGAFCSLEAQHVDEELIARSRWLFIEGYVAASGPPARGALLEAVACARAHGTKVALTLSADWVVKEHRAFVRELARESDLVFGNEKEARALTESSDTHTAWNRLKELANNAVVTLGEKGALLKYEGFESKIDAVRCVPVDSTGAGDMYAGAFLFGITHGIPAGEAARSAAHMATRVVCQYGARLEGDVKGLYSKSREVAPARQV